VRAGLRAEGYQDGTSSLVLEYNDPEGNVVISDTVNYTFIAALCGRQPTPDERTVMVARFPGLVHCEWSILAGVSQSYNCIAWSVDESDHWYNMNEIDGLSDNDGIFEDEDMDAFYAAKKGWSRIEEGFDEEKADEAEAMYYSFGEPWDYVEDEFPPGPGGHAARRGACSCGQGQWIMYTSKDGPLLLFEHVWDQLNSGLYEDPDIFYN